MKRFLAILLLCWSWNAWTQPFLRNSLNTNNLGTNLVWDPSGTTLTMSGSGPQYVLHNTAGGANQKRFYLASVANRLEMVWVSDNGASSLTLGSFDTNGNFVINGYAGFSGQTNRLTMASGQLLLDGSPISGGGGSVFVNGTNVTNPNIIDGGNTTWAIQSGTNVVSTANATNDVTYNSITVQSNTFNVAKGGSLTITNFTRYAYATLTLSGTNVSAISLTNSSAFKLTLTTNAFFGVPTDLPGTNFQQTIQIHVIQDSTGGRTVTFTNSSWNLAATDPSTNAVPVISTNANAVTLFTFSTSPFTVSRLYGAVSPFIP